MIISAQLLAFFHGVIIMPILIVVPLVLLYGVLANKRFVWLERCFLVVGFLTLLSFVVIGECVLTRWEQELLGENAYQGGFVKHQLSYIGIYIQDIVTTIVLFSFGLMGILAVGLQYYRERVTKSGREQQGSSI